jgi:hypothetical protein
MRHIDETPLSVLIVGYGVLTGCRVRNIRSLSSQRPSSADTGIGQNSLKTLPVWAYQGKMTGEPAVVEAYDFSQARQVV